MTTTTTTLNEIAAAFAAVARSHDTDAYLAALEAAGVTNDALEAMGLCVCGDKLVVAGASREAVVAVAGATISERLGSRFTGREPDEQDFPARTYGGSHVSGSLDDRNNDN